MDELKKFTNWWSLMAAAGVAILIAAINQQNPAGMYFRAAARRHRRMDLQADAH
ncbi:hypothetical protein [Bradyrhizobium sp. C9]|uniref:hypothetical protein n=1 Tax=Bradyrhizobium sp. C9 TaxID=142585 RepID=UPI0013046F18|nr:hypothetical protein [Bradyrhizobium sp. C9]